MTTNIVALPVGRLALNCNTVILNELECYGTATTAELRVKCCAMAEDYSVENVNAALNDLMNKFVIMQTGINTFESA